MYLVVNSIVIISQVLFILFDNLEFDYQYPWQVKSMKVQHASLNRRSK